MCRFVVQMFVSLFPLAVVAAAQTSNIHHYEYVFPDQAIYVYDMDNNFSLAKQILIPQALSMRGVVVTPETHMLYISYGGDGGKNGNGSMLKYDLLNDTIVWTKSYTFGVDSMAASADGSTIYMPRGEAYTGTLWKVIDARTGNVIGQISGGKSPHNTLVSLDGANLYLGGRNYNYLEVASTATNTVWRSIGPLRNGVRPFTINGKQTLAFTTATGFLGFQVSSIVTGQVLFTVPIAGFSWNPATSPTCPSHGISLSPDEKEIYVMDSPNSYVHVFDVSNLPNSAPIQVANIPLTRSTTGFQSPCVYDCRREGWLQHSLDGRFVFVGESGDIIDTTLRKSIANLDPLYHTKKHLEVEWENGVPVATSSRQGMGYVTQ